MLVKSNEVEARKTFRTVISLASFVMPFRTERQYIFEKNEGHDTRMEIFCN